MKSIPCSTFFCSACNQEKDSSERHLSRSRFILCLSCASRGRYCPRCTSYQEFSSFAKDHHGHRRGGVVGYCRQCKHELYKEKYTLEKYRAHKLKTRFNLTQAEYDEMFARQNGLCAICHQPETAMDNTGKRIRALAVDHDHETGAIRGLLCGFCNYLLGYVKDNAELLQAANEYLRKHNKLPHEWPEGGRLL